LIIGTRMRLTRLHAANHFDERQERHRIEEVHADEALGLVERRGERGDRNRRRIGRDDGVRAHHGFDLPQDADLELGVFRGRFDHDVGGGEALVVGGRLDARERRIARRRRELVLRDEAFEAAGERGDALRERGVGHVDQDRLQARDGCDLRDAVAHGPGADDADGVDFHALLLSAGAAHRAH
jgi:hypothetical protein